MPRKMKSLELRVLIAALSAVGLGACGVEETPPRAPSNLTAAVVTNGVHLTWTDNSPDEESFMVMRRTADGGYLAVGETAPDVRQFHDSSVGAAVTYVYLVHAVRGTESSAPSNEVQVSIP